MICVTARADLPGSGVPRFRCRTGHRTQCIPRARLYFLPFIILGTTVPNMFESLGLGPEAIIGGIGTLIFYGRFYLQWYTSERQKRSVVPIGFWYMSSVGALILFAYGVYTQSAVGTLAYCFNIVIYMRNLIHIWRAKGALSARRSWLAHGGAAVIVLVAVGLLILTWLNVLQKTPSDDAARTWFWIAVGAAGNGLFACRFVIQWLATERRKESVIPVSFWYFSVAAALFMLASYIQLHDWIFAVGVATTLPIYSRNLWLIHRRKQEYSELA